MTDAADIAARPALVVCDLVQARAALRAAREAGTPVALWSPPGAAAYWGAAYFAALEARARAEASGADAVAVLDCDADAGYAMAALRCGVRALCFTGPEPVRTKLADMAAQAGAALLGRRPEAADLADAEDPLAAARAALAGCR